MTSRKTPRCQICKRELKCASSINRGIGPECLEKRQSYVAAAGSSVEEVETLATSANPHTQRFARAAYGAIGDGRRDLVIRFLAAARSAERMAA